MMNLHQEHHFEREIWTHLAANGWLYAEGDAALFNRTHSLFLPDLLAWVEATQPDSWQRLSKTHGASLPQVLAERVRKSLNLPDRGTLDVLRRGVEMLGLNQYLSHAINTWTLPGGVQASDEDDQRRLSAFLKARPLIEQALAQRIPNAPWANPPTASQPPAILPAISTHESSIAIEPLPRSDFLPGLCDQRRALSLADPEQCRAGYAGWPSLS